MGFLKKIRSKPRETKIIILWSIILPLGIILFFFWIRITANSIKELSETAFPEMEKDFFPSEGLEESMESMRIFFNEEEIKTILEKIEEESQKEEIKEENEN